MIKYHNITMFKCRIHITDVNLGRGDQLALVG